MTKKLIIIIAAVLILSVIGVGAYFIIRDYTGGATFTVEDTLADGQGKSAKVILLGGQSNASGCSVDEYLKKNVSPEKYTEYENGYDNVYINYYVSGNNESGGFVKCSTRQGEAGGHFGPELGLAEKLHADYPNETFFIIKCAWGDTNLYDKWLSPSSKGETGKKYKDFVNFVSASLEYLTKKNYDIEIEGMCWMQGESDSFMVESATDYEHNLNNFIKDIRRKFSRYASEDGIAFIDAYIADNPMYWVYCDLVNAGKLAVAESSPMNELIDTIGAGLITSEEPAENPDIPHYDSKSEIKLGNLFAEYVEKHFD